MKRFLKYAVIAMVALATASCEWSGSGDSRDPQNLGLALWDISKQDLTRVNEIFDFIAHYNHLLTIDDEQERKDYLHTHFYDMIITVNGNVHMITRNTAYDTKYYTIIEMNADNWRVRRSGGNSYDLTIRAEGADRYTVEFNELYINESKGYGNLDVSLAYDEGKPTIKYSGELVMIDPEESSAKPLTVTTRITKPIAYLSHSHFVEGELTVKAYDALYDNTDEAKITILNNEFNNQIIIECLGSITGYKF